MRGSLQATAGEECWLWCLLRHSALHCSASCTCRPQPGGSTGCAACPAALGSTARVLHVQATAWEEHWLWCLPQVLWAQPLASCTCRPQPGRSTGSGVRTGTARRGAQGAVRPRGWHVDVWGAPHWGHQLLPAAGIHLPPQVRHSLLAATWPLEHHIRVHSKVAAHCLC